MEASILIIEFDPVVGRLLQDSLEREGFRIVWSRDGRSGLEHALNGHTDLILLNLMIPGIDGWKILKKFQKIELSVPVIALCVQDDETIKVKALNEGCDDFITIPFSLSELHSRTRAILRRTCKFRKTPSVLRYGSLVLEQRSEKVMLEEKEIKLTKIEYKILTLLVGNAGKVVHRFQIIDEIWGEETDITTRAVDMHIHRIRSKHNELEKRIETIYQRGYRLNVM